MWGIFSGIEWGRHGLSGKKYIWGEDIGNGRHNLLVGQKEVHGNGVSCTRDMVWEVHDGVKDEDGGYKRQEFGVTSDVVKTLLEGW